MGGMEHISWSEHGSIRRVFGVFENERMLIAKAAVKKMGLQGLFIEYFEDNIIPLPKSP